MKREGEEEEEGGEDQGELGQGDAHLHEAGQQQQHQRQQHQHPEGNNVWKHVLKQANSSNSSVNNTSILKETTSGMRVMFTQKCFFVAKSA